MNLDEYDEKALWAEIIRRQHLQQQGLCDYCGNRRGVSLKEGVREKYAGDPNVEKYVETASDGPCRFAERHNLKNVIKRIDPREFREQGYLQELNRRFLHPLGLAMEIVVESNGLEHLGGVWDYRDDPEGMVYGKTGDQETDEQQHRIMVANAMRIENRLLMRREVRIEALGFFIQPVDKL
jgi:hypothetical protein